MNTKTLSAIGLTMALCFLSDACERDQHITSPARSPSLSLNASIGDSAVDILRSYLGPAASLVPADTSATALEAGVAAAGGLAFVSLKSPAALASSKAGGFRAAISATDVRGGIQMLVSQPGVQLLDFYRRLGIVRARLVPGAAAALRSSSFVDFVEPALNARVQPELRLTLPATWARATKWMAPKRPELSGGTQIVPWNVSQISAPAAWSTSRGVNAKVMMMFWGLAATDPVFPTVPSGNCGGFLHACGGAPYYNGTLQFGVLFSRDTSFGIVGVAPGVQGSNIYLWNPYFASYDSISISSIVDGLNSAISSGVQVVYTDVVHTNKFQSEGTAIAQAIAAGATVITGMWINGQRDTVTWPGSWPNVINVSGVTPTGAFAPAGTCAYWGSGSDYGPMVTMAAPISAYTTYGNSSYTDLWTFFPGHECNPSLSAAHVAGVAALLRDLHPSWTSSQITQALIGTASGGGTRISDYYGYGLVNAAAAVGFVPLSVTMTGPTRVKPNQQCGWWANPTGGVPPYSYTWIPPGNYSGDPNEVIESFSGTGTVTLTVWAYDAVGEQATVSQRITLSSSAPNCTT